MRPGSESLSGNSETKLSSLGITIEDIQTEGSLTEIDDVVDVEIEEGTKVKYVSISVSNVLVAQFRLDIEEQELLSDKPYIHPSVVVQYNDRLYNVGNGHPVVLH